MDTEPSKLPILKYGYVIYEPPKLRHARGGGRRESVKKIDKHEVQQAVNLIAPNSRCPQSGRVLTSITGAFE